MPANLPTKFEFQRQTDLALVASAKRIHDPILQRIDVLLDEFHGRESQGDVRIQLFVLAKLYYATNNWLRQADTGSNQVNPRRRGPVYSFYKAVVDSMIHLTGVPVNLMPFWLKENFGKTLTAHGVDIDLATNAAKYLTPEERNRMRLVF